MGIARTYQRWRSLKTIIMSEIFKKNNIFYCCIVLLLDTRLKWSRKTNVFTATKERKEVGLKSYSCNAPSTIHSSHHLLQQMCNAFILARCPSFSGVSCAFLEFAWIIFKHFSSSASRWLPNYYCLADLLCNGLLVGWLVL